MEIKIQFHLEFYQRPIKDKAMANGLEILDPLVYGLVKAVAGLKLKM